jgi:hypothetical protein
LGRFNPTENVGIHHKWDLLLDAAYLLSQEYEEGKKNGSRGVVEMVIFRKDSMTIKLTIQSRWSPNCSTITPRDIQAIMYEIVIQAVCSDDLKMTSLTHRDMVCFCRQIEILSEALHILKPQPNLIPLDS